MTFLVVAAASAERFAKGQAHEHVMPARDRPPSQPGIDREPVLPKIGVVENVNSPELDRGLAVNPDSIGFEAAILATALADFEAENMNRGGFGALPLSVALEGAREQQTGVRQIAKQQAAQQQEATAAHHAVNFAARPVDPNACPETVTIRRNTVPDTHHTRRTGLSYPRCSFTSPRKGRNCTRLFISYRPQ